MRLEFTAKSLDDTLPTVTFGDGDNIGHGAFFKRVCEGVLFSEVFVGPVELIAHASTGKPHLHDVGNFAGYAGERVRLGGNDEADFAQVGLLEVLHVLRCVVLLSLWDALEQFWEGVGNLLGLGPHFATGLHAVGRHFVASYAKDAHLGALHHGDRNTSFLTGGGATGVQITG